MTNMKRQLEPAYTLNEIMRLMIRMNKGQTE